MVGFEGLAVGVTEGVRELVAWMVDVVTEGLSGEVETPKETDLLATARLCLGASSDFKKAVPT
jgi:hypothetical protein